MKTSALLSRQEEAKALRALQENKGSSKGFLDTWNKVRSRAIHFVLDQRRVREHLGDRRHAAVGADLRPGRCEHLGLRRERIGEVGIYDYDRNTLLVVVVDLRKGTVLDLEERTGVQPPLSSSELAEAKALVLAHKSYRRLAKERTLQVQAFAARVSFLPGHPALGHRVFTLTIWSGGKKPRKLGEAVVDLSDRKVLGEDDHDDAVLMRFLEGKHEHSEKEGA